MAREQTMLPDHGITGQHAGHALDIFKLAWGDDVKTGLFLICVPVFAGIGIVVPWLLLALGIEVGLGADRELLVKALFAQKEGVSGLSNGEEGLLLVLLPIRIKIVGPEVERGFVLQKT